MGALIYLLTHETDNIEELSVLDLERIGDFVMRAQQHRP